MAFNYTDQANGVGIPFNYTRGNPLPLDSWSLFTTYDQADAYAKTNPVSYPGQVLTVIENGASKLYIIGVGQEYTSAQKAIDDAWYDEKDANHEAFWTNNPTLWTWKPKKHQGTEVGDDYTQEEKDLDDEWYDADESTGKITFKTAHSDIGGFTPAQPEGTPAGELQGTRTLIEMGTKDYVDQKSGEASQTAIMYWLS